MAWSIFGSSTSPKSWAESLLHAIGAPSTPANVQSIIAWEVLEGGGGTNNPLNTTLGGFKGESNFNSVGVKNYSSIGEGITATADTLRGSAYAQIVAALKSGHGLGSGHFAGLSTWSGGGYSSVAGAWSRAAMYMSGKGGIIRGVGPGSAMGGGGSGGGGGSSGTGASQAQLTSFLSAPSGVLSEAGALLHGTAVIIDRAFGLFAPGQGWRIVFGATAAASGYGSYRAFHQGGEDGDGNLPLAVLLLGVGTIALFMMARPWPQTAAGPIKPGAYVVDVLEGQPPPAGPAAFSADEVHLTEAGLAAILAVWAAGKAGQALGGLAAGAAAAGGILGRLWGWIKGLGGEATPGEVPPAEVPPVELPPVV